MPSPSLALLRTQTDERLVELARAGHERAFETIVERYRKPLLRGARRVLPEGRAEDALQQALLSAWTALQRGDEVRELRPWLYRIVHNTSLNALRVSGYEYAELHEAARIADEGDDELERRAVMRQTLASLAALPERQRQALIRTAVSGDSHEQIARDLGLSGNALRQLVHRARVSVRAAATALTPMPLVTAAASGSSRGDSLVERLSELVAGGGASLTLAKAGTVAVLAGSAISGPAIVHRVTDRPVDRRVAEAAVSPPRHARQAAAAAQPEPVVAARHEVVSAPAPRKYRGGRSGKGGGGDEHHSRSGSSGSGSSGSSGSGSSGSDDDHSGSGHKGSGGEDSGSSGSSGSGSSGSGNDDSGSSDSSGSGSSGSSGSDSSESSGSGSSGSTGSDSSESESSASSETSGGSGSSGSGSSGSSGSSDSSGSSGGSGKDDAAEPSATPEPDDD
jgi:RNA polymerase sigma factor (sigma-70 family)